MARPVRQQQDDNFATGTDTVTVPTFAVGSGDNRSLVAFLFARDDNSPTFIGSDISFDLPTPEVFTYRWRWRVTWAGNNRSAIAEIWTLDNPSNDTDDIIAIVSESCMELALVVAEYTGANNGVGSIEAGDGANANNDSPSADADTDDVEGLLLAAVVGQTGQSPVTPGTGVTEIADGENNITWWAGEKDADGGIVTIDCTLDGSTRWAECLVELLPAPAAAPRRIFITHV